ncbi:MAG: hypothetical protein VB088_08175 [Sphaerochaeta sp.]|nr:hypothetical protein [Sphaerochaeta sp.]
MAIDILFPNGIQMQQLIDASPDTLDMTSAPVVTIQTITSTKAKIPASAKIGRRVMVVTNLDEVRTVRIGSISITEKIGLLIDPKKTVKVLLDPNNAQDVYAIATGAEAKVEVIEV